MERRRGTSLGLVLTCLVAYCAGVDDDVQQVALPNVVKFPLGPRMEVLSGGGPREMRAANFHGFPSGCLSCTTGFGSSSHGSGYRPGVLRPFPGPESSSHKHEVRTESKSVNGEPVYDMFHERRFEDGTLVHDERREKGSRDIDASFRVGEVRGYPEGSGYSRNIHETHVQSSSVGSSRQEPAGGNFALGETSLGFDSLSERLRQQMHLLQKGHDIPGGRGSHRAVYSERRYVNGQPVYEKKEERKYEDGQLIYNNTDEKGPGDLGTQHVSQQYDSAGALVGPSTGGVYERREEQRQYSSSSQGSGYYPQAPSGNVPGGVGSSYSYWQEWHGSSSPSYNPSGGYATQYGQDSSRESYRPSYTPTSSSSSSQYSHESRGSSSYNPSYRPASSSSSSHYSHDSSLGYRPSYRPSSSSSSSHYSQESREDSSVYRPSYRPSSGSSHYSQDSREESSSAYRPSSSSSSSHYSHESRGESSSAYRPSYRPSSSSSSTHYSQDSREESSSSYRPSSSSISSSHYQETQETSSAYRPSYRPAGSTSTVYTHESREESPSRWPSHRPSSSITPTPSPEDSREESSSYRPHRPTGGSSTQYTQTREESREETSSNYRPYRPSSGSSSTYHSHTREESSSAHRPSYRPSSGGYSSSREETSRQDSSTSYANQPDRWTQTQQPSDDRRDSAIITQSRDESSSSYRPSTDRSTHYSQESREESSHQYGYRQPVSSTNRREESYESSWQGYGQTQSPDDHHSTLVQQNARFPEDTTQGSADVYRRGESTETHSRGGYGSGGARTTTLDLSSSSSTSGSSFTDQLLGSSRGHGHDTEEEIGQVSQSYEYNQREDRFSSRRNQDSSSERGQSSREDTNRVGIPGVLSGPPTDNGNDEKYNKDRYDISPLDDSGPVLPSVDNEIDSSDFRTVGPVDEEVDSAFISREESYRHDDGSRHRTSRPDTTTQVSPGRGHGESSYHYYENRTSSRETAGGVPSYGHSQVSETGDASSHSYPTVEGSTRYHYNESRRHSTTVDGHSQPAYGSSSTSSSTSHVTNCGGQVNCVVVGDGQVTSSKRTQTRVSTRYVNGELVGITHHVRYYEDGRLVHENQTEKTIDELTDEDLRKYGIEHLQLVQGSYQPESYSQRHEVRQEKKYVNGEQVYDLHHERRFEDGGLVYENRTEKDENDFGVGRQHPAGLDGSYSQTYHGADQRHEVTQSQHLQQHVSSDTLGGIAGGSSETRQVTDTAHISAVPVYTSHRYEARRQQEFVNGQPTYDLHHERRYKNGSLIYENKTELNEDDLQSSSSEGHYDALHQILAGQTLNTASESSYRGSSAASQGSSSSSYGGGVSASHGSYGGSSLSQTSDSSYSGSSSAGRASSYHGSESQQTGEYGGSASSQGGYYGSYSASSSRESHESRSPAIPVGATSGSSRASTTVLGGGSYSSSSQQESSSGGCLSCMLIGGSGYSSSHGSVGASGGAAAGGYSHRQEMSVEERYEDGQLVHGQEEERVFEDGQLVHENRRQYSDPSQSSHASALQSASFSRDGVVSGSCDNSYCKNGGTCIPGYTGPLCTCPFGFKGHDCSEPFCPKRFCRYGGTCTVVGESHMCSCQPGFAGYRCQTRTRRHARRHASKP